MAVTIRRLRMSDYASVIEVLRTCGLNPHTRGRESRKNLAMQLRSRQTVYLGAFDGSKLVATVFGTHDTRKGWINRLGVLPEYRHRGIAERLVRAVERRLRARGLEIFAALIDSDNLASQSLFIKLGYDDQGVHYFRRKLREDV